MSAQDKYSLQERGRFKAWWDAARPLEGSAFPYEIAWAAWQAALSAQPSPGGQGDAPVSLPLYRLADDANGNRGLHRDDTGSWVKLQDVERALAARQPVGENPAWRDELVREAYNRGLADGLNADRQPVGEPVAHRLVTGDPKRKWMVVQGAPSIGVIRQAQEYGWEIECFYSHTFKPATPSWAAPPTQAVDLGRFRKLASWVVNCAGHGINDSQRRMGEELLALIDSQAVGK